jgi:hypothetical protein
VTLFVPAEQKAVPHVLLIVASAVLTAAGAAVEAVVEAVAEAVLEEVAVQLQQKEMLRLYIIWILAKSALLILAAKALKHALEESAWFLPEFVVMQKTIPGTIMDAVMTACAGQVRHVKTTIALK